MHLCVCLFAYLFIWEGRIHLGPGAQGRQYMLGHPQGSLALLGQSAAPTVRQGAQAPRRPRWFASWGVANRRLSRVHALPAVPFPVRLSSAYTKVPVRVHPQAGLVKSAPVSFLFSFLPFYRGESNGDYFLFKAFSLYVDTKKKLSTGHVGMLNGFADKQHPPRTKDLK